MSGGHFNYVQDRFRDEVFEKLTTEIALNKVQPFWIDKEQWEAEGKSRWKPETIKEFRKGLKKAKEAYVYIQRIDWLLSGDDDEEETFHKRLKEELKQC